MSKNTLETKFSLIDSIHSQDWKTVMMIQQSLLKGIGTVKSFEWRGINTYKNNSEYYGQPDLTDISVWSTYDGWGKSRFDACINIIFFQNKDLEIECHAQIYDGDLLDGRRRDMRFTVEIIFPKDILINLREDINHKFNLEMDAQYEEHLEAERQKWIEKRKKQLLNIK